MIIDIRIAFAALLTTSLASILVMAVFACIICPLIAHKFSLENPDDAYCDAAQITVAIVWSCFFITIVLMWRIL